MGLDFSAIKDSAGAALYIIHTNFSLDVKKFIALADQIRRDSTHQVVLIDAQSEDGRKICDFYDISPETLPVALIIRDDDSITHQWNGGEIPTNPKDLIFFLDQIG